MTRLIAILIFIPHILCAQTGWDWAVSNSSSGCCVETIGNPLAVDKNGNVYVAMNSWADSTWFGNDTVPNPGKYQQLIISKFDSSGHFNWATETQYCNVTPLGMASDGDGNLYVLASFSGTICGIDSVLFASGSGSGSFLIKFSPSGNIIWTNTLGNLTPAAIALDRWGNIYLTGIFYRTITIGAITYVSTDTTMPEVEAYLAKIDANDNTQWITSGGYPVANVTALVVTGSGNIYVAGAYGIDTFYLDTFKLINPALTDTYGVQEFLLKFDSSGDPIWARNLVHRLGFNNLGTPVYGHCMATDASENIYMTGHGSGAVVGTDSVNGAYMVKYDPNGNITWLYLSGSSSCSGSSVTVDSCQNAWFNGQMNSNRYYDSGKAMDFDGQILPEPPGSTDPEYIVGYGVDGSYIFSTALKSGGGGSAGIAVDNKGSFFLAEGYTGTLTFGNDSVYCVDTSYLLCVAKYKYDSIDCHLELNTGILSKPSINIMLYPNPAYDVVNVDMESAQPFHALYSMMSIEGKEIMTGTLQQGNNIISVRQLPAGMYMLRVTDPATGFVTTHKLIKE